jgi:hypothetical protein
VIRLEWNTGLTDINFKTEREDGGFTVYRKSKTGLTSPVGHKMTLFSTSVLSAVTSPEIRHYPNVLTEVFNHINEHEIQNIEFKISYIFTDTVELGYDVVKGTKYNILCRYKRVLF